MWSVGGGGMRNLDESFIVFRRCFKPEGEDGRRIGDTLLTFLVSRTVACQAFGLFCYPLIRIRFRHRGKGLYQ